MSSDRIRLEIAFDGGQVIAANVDADRAEALERALSAGAQETFPLEADDGYYTVALKRVVWVKRFQRESRVGFGA